MVTKRDDDDDRPTDDRVNIEQSASGWLEGRVLQKIWFPEAKSLFPTIVVKDQFWKLDLAKARQSPADPTWRQDFLKKNLGSLQKLRVVMMGRRIRGD